MLVFYTDACNIRCGMKRPENIVLPVPSLAMNDSVLLAAEKMWGLEVPVLPVVGEGGVYAGIVSIFTLLKRRIPGWTKIRSVLEKAPGIEGTSDHVAIARAFVKTGFPGLAVVADSRPVGVVTARSLILAIGLSSRVPAGMLAYPVKPLSPRDSVEQARKVMANVGLRIMPVASEDKLLGIVNIYDLLRYYVFSTSLKRDRYGEVRGEEQQLLERPVNTILREVRNVVHVDSPPLARDLAEGAVVVDSKERVVGVISPFLLLRRLLPAVEESVLPVRIEGLEDLGFIERQIIYRRVIDTAGIVARRGRLLEFSVVLKPRGGGKERRRYEAIATIRLDVGVHSARAESWEAVEAATGAVEAAYRRFSRTKGRARKRREDRSRTRKASL